MYAGNTYGLNVRILKTHFLSSVQYAPTPLPCVDTLWSLYIYVCLTEALKPSNKSNCIFESYIIIYYYIIIH